MKKTSSNFSKVCSSQLIIPRKLSAIKNVISVHCAQTNVAERSALVTSLVANKNTLMPVIHATDALKLKSRHVIAIRKNAHAISEV